MCLISIVIMHAILLITSCENNNLDQKKCEKQVYNGIAKKERACVRNFEDIPIGNKLIRYFDKTEYFKIKTEIYNLVQCEKVVLVKLFKIENFIVFNAKIIIDNKAQDLLGFKIKNEIFFESLGALIDLDLMFYDEQKNNTFVEKIGVYGELIRIDNVFLTFYMYYDFKKDNVSFVFADEGIPFGSY